MMIVDQSHDVVLAEFEHGRYGLPYYIVHGGGVKRREFHGESAYANAERYWNDQLNKIIYGRP